MPLSDATSVPCRPAAASPTSTFPTPRLQQVSRVFHDAAVELLQLLPDDPELTACLRKLREAKDCAVLLAATEGVRSDG